MAYYAVKRPLGGKENGGPGSCQDHQIGDVSLSVVNDHALWRDSEQIVQLIIFYMQDIFLMLGGSHIMKTLKS